MQTAQRLAAQYLKGMALQAAQGAKLDSTTRRRINQALVRVGLDGNGTFRKPGEGVAAALGILADFDIQQDEIINSSLFVHQENRIQIDLAFSNLEDAFSPTPISNSLLVITYYQRQSGNYEVTAMVS